MAKDSKHGDWVFAGLIISARYVAVLFEGGSIWIGNFLAYFLHAIMGFLYFKYAHTAKGQPFTDWSTWIIPTLSILGTTALQAVIFQKLQDDKENWDIGTRLVLFLSSLVLIGSRVWDLGCVTALYNRSAPTGAFLPDEFTTGWCLLAGFSVIWGGFGIIIMQKLLERDRYVSIGKR